MKILKIKINGIVTIKEDLEISFITNQNVRNVDDENITKIFTIGETNIYINNTINFLGMNASGKTTILNIIAFCIYLNKGSHIMQHHELISNKMYLDKNVVLTTFLYNENTKFVSKSVIEIKKEINQINDVNLIVVNEWFYEKKLSSIRSKKELFEFNESNIVHDRKDAQYKHQHLSLNAQSIKSHNILQSFSNAFLSDNKKDLISFLHVTKGIVNILDSSIDYLNIYRQENYFELKFKMSDILIKENLNCISDYLSSGTFKGLALFNYALIVLKNGGYLLIDELENHFNKTLACCLLDIFNNESINKNGAVLIFTTHYIELLDTLSRKDSINIVTKEGMINVENFSNLVKRSDYKTSDYILSGTISPTVPSYENYMIFKKTVREFVGE